MPIWLRMFTFNKIKEYHEKQNKANDSKNNIISNDKKTEISKPNISPKPDYTFKAPKK
jgi:hypothetical protein